MAPLPHAIVKLTHPSGITVYIPRGQRVSDTMSTLERDGLIRCEYDEHGKRVGTITVYDSRNIRVLCWMLTENSVWRHRGHTEDVFDLPIDLLDQAPSEMERIQ
jgi:hypothetical protein